MKPDSFFRLEGHVKPENLDLFIKVCCLFIEDRTRMLFIDGGAHMHRCTAYYDFNSDATVIRCFRIDVPEKKKSRENAKPDNTAAQCVHR
jgi:hypothetical protein